MKQHFINTLKISLAALAATLLAQSLGLDFAASAGIIAILSIQSTKKETLQVAAGRCMAFVIALGLAYVAFGLLGFTMGGYGLYLVPYIFICLYFRWNMAIAMNSVLITHFWSKGSMDLPMLINESAIFVIGVAAGIITNLHLRKNIDYIEKLKGEADSQIRRYLLFISKMILYNRNLQEEDYFRQLSNDIRVAKNVAEENYRNQFKHTDVYDREYIKMREKQSYVLYEMEKVARRIQENTVSTNAIAGFIRKVSAEYSKDNTVEQLLQSFEILRKSIKEKPLPVKREEFEDRARLFMLLQLLEEFLLIKAEFMRT